jgi:hypothetical protein
MSVQVIRERGAEKQPDAQNMARHAKPVFRKRRQQNDHQKRHDKDPQKGQAIWQVQEITPRKCNESMR